MDSFFRTAKKITVITLIVGVALLVFFAILSIWEVLSSDILHKSIASMATISVASALIILSAKLGLEETKLGSHKFSVGRIILLVVGVYVLFSILSLAF